MSPKTSDVEPAGIGPAGNGIGDASASPTTTGVPGAFEQASGTAPASAYGSESQTESVGESHADEAVRVGGELLTDKFGSLLPPIPEDRYRSLLEDIRAEGQLVPIVVDEDREVIDGLNRLRACRETGIQPRWRMRRGLSHSQKVELAYALNLNRRQLSKKVIKEINEKRLSNLLKLRDKDAKTWTHEKIAARLGMSATWVRNQEDRIRGTANTVKKDGRRTHDLEKVAEGVRLVLEGAGKPKDVAANLGLKERVLRLAVNKARKAEAASATGAVPEKSTPPEAPAPTDGAAACSPMAIDNLLDEWEGKIVAADRPKFLRALRDAVEFRLASLEFASESSVEASPDFSNEDTHACAGAGRVGLMEVPDHILLEVQP